VSEGKVIPFGYSAPDSRSALDRLMASERTYLVDVRYSTRSVNKPEWSADSLKESYGARYLWIKDLGNINYFGHGPIQIAHPEIGIPRLMNGLKQGYTLILLCTCTRYEGCHRKVVIDLLLESMPDAQIEVPDMVALTNSIRCISIRQPWAWLITHPDILLSCNIPVKDVENREWEPRIDVELPVPLLIHAGKSVDNDLFLRGRLDESYFEYKFGKYGVLLCAAMPQTKEDYACGSIVGESQFTGVVTDVNSPWFNGSYGLQLIHARALETPIPYRGALRVFNVPRSVVEPEGVKLYV